MLTRSTAISGIYVPKHTLIMVTTRPSQQQNNIVANVNEIEEIPSTRPTRSRSYNTPETSEPVWNCCQSIMAGAIVLLTVAVITLILLLITWSRSDTNDSNGASTVSQGGNGISAASITSTVSGGTITSIGSNGSTSPISSSSTVPSNSNSSGTTTTYPGVSSSSMASTTTSATFNFSACNTTGVGSVCAGNGTLVTFDDLPNNFLPIPNCYNNINWGNGYYLNGYSVGNTSGYYTTTVSGNNSLYNWGGLPMSMTSATGRLFILNSVVVAAAWDDNLSLTVTGYHSSAIIRNQTFTLQVFTASYLNFSGYSGLDTVIFTTSGGTLDPNVFGNGTQFGMDNVCLTFI